MLVYTLWRVVRSAVVDPGPTHGVRKPAVRRLALAAPMELQLTGSQTLRSGQVAHGFVQALGNLFILWVLSSLISAEVRYVLRRGVHRGRAHHTVAATHHHPCGKCRPS